LLKNEIQLSTSHLYSTRYLKTGWFKFRIAKYNNLYAKVVKNSKAFISIRSNRVSHISFWYILTRQKLPNPRSFNSSIISNVKQSLINAKNSSGFFIDYRKHSQDIIEIIENGFGRKSGILGYCIHNPLNGISIEFPKLPKLKDIGLAEHHIQYGYPDIWTIKSNAETECNRILKDIESIYRKIELKIFSIDKNIVKQEITQSYIFHNLCMPTTHGIHTLWK
jgi:hypothetical protein